MQKYYATFDAFVLPSRYEGLPLVAVEAQAMNLPTLLSTEITHEADVGGIYCFADISSPRVWADEMQKVYDERPKYDVHDSLVGSNFDIENETHRLENFYKEIVGR